jgi:hypothetical protein
MRKGDAHGHRVKMDSFKLIFGRYLFFFLLRRWLSGTFSCGCPKGLLGSPYSQHGTLWQARGGPQCQHTQCLETIRAGDNRAIVLCRQR